jgi:hypothetical protein
VAGAGLHAGRHSKQRESQCDANNAVDATIQLVHVLAFDGRFMINSVAKQVANSYKQPAHAALGESAHSTLTRRGFHEGTLFIDL